MSISAASVWEVRPGAGSDNNGGFFVPGSSGTDYSQQNSPQYTLSGVTTSGASAVLLTASASADMVGNGLQITAGTNATKAIYQVVSVVVGTSITLDRTATTGSGSAISCNIGGAMASTTSILTGLGINSANQGVSGNTIYLKATGNLVFTATQSNFNVTNFSIIGYSSTRGDNGQATITTATNSVILFQVNNTGQQWQFFNIIFTSTATTRLAAVDDNSNTTDYLYFNNCVFNGPLSALKTRAQAHNVTFVNCIVENCTSSTAALDLECIALKVVGCYIHDNTGDGVRINTTSNAGVSGSAVFLHSVVKSNGGKGINNIGDLQGNGAISMVIDHCAIINNTSDGVNHQGSGTNFGQELGILNSIIDSNGGFGVNVASSLASGTFAQMYGYSNFYRSNTSGARNNFPALPGDVTGTADPFTNRSSGDFSLNSTSGGGAACANAGWPGSPQWIGATAGSESIGPIVPAAGGGSSAVYVVNQVINRYVTEER